MNPVNAITIEDLKIYPKGRPKFNRKTGGIYFLHSDDEEALSWMIRKASSTPHIPFSTLPLEENLSVWLNIYFKKKARGDVDNYAKTVLDAGNKILWKDDKQIKELHVSLFENVGYDSLEIRWDVRQKKVEKDDSSITLHHEER